MQKSWHRFPPFALVIALFLLAPATGTADCTCVPLTFSFSTTGAYEASGPITFKQACNRVLADIDSKFQPFAAGTCNSLGMFGGLCQVTMTMTTPCFGSNGYYFGAASYSFSCLSCGL